MSQTTPDPVSGSNDPFTDVNKEANDIGLTTCGADSGGGSDSSS